MTRRVEILGEMFTAVEFGETRFYDLPCVYLMAHEREGELRIVYAGQTHCLRERFSGHHQLAAAKALGATHGLVLVVRDQRDRRELETLLRWELRPPLNAEEIPRAMQAWRAAMHFLLEESQKRASSSNSSSTSTFTPAWPDRQHPRDNNTDERCRASAWLAVVSTPSWFDPSTSSG
jgi:hypothetical protein